MDFVLMDYVVHVLALIAEHLKKQIFSMFLSFPKVRVTRECPPIATRLRFDSEICLFFNLILTRLGEVEFI